MDATASNGAPAKRNFFPLGLLIGVLIVVGMPILEVYVLIQVGRLIGVLPTIGLLLLEAVIGTWLLKREGGRAWRALNAAIGTGRMPSQQLADGALVLVGGVLLILPGFVTDLLGFFCLLPFTRPLARKVLAFMVARRVARLGLDVPVARAKMDRDNLIHGETVEEPTGKGPDTDDGRPISGEIVE